MYMFVRNDHRCFNVFIYRMEYDAMQVSTANQVLTRDALQILFPTYLQIYKCRCLIGSRAVRKIYQIINKRKHRTLGIPCLLACALHHEIGDYDTGYDTAKIRQQPGNDGQTMASVSILETFVDSRVQTDPIWQEYIHKGKS